MKRKMPTGAQELGFALQDRLFDDKGQFYMPDAPTIDIHFPTCDPSSAASRAATCSPPSGNESPVRPTDMVSSGRMGINRRSTPARRSSRSYTSGRGTMIRPPGGSSSAIRLG